jgi:hypothetical protein
MYGHSWQRPEYPGWPTSSRHEPRSGYRAGIETLKLWRWYLPDLKGKLKPSRWRMTEDEAQSRHPGCIKVEGSLEVRQFEPDAGHSMDAGLVRRSDGAMVPRDRLREF